MRYGVSATNPLDASFLAAGLVPHRARSIPFSGGVALQAALKPAG